MNWAAARGRPHRDEGALSDQGDVPRDLFARRQCAGARLLGQTIGKWFPWVATHEEALRALFGAYVEAKQRPERARLRRPPALFRADAGGADDCQAEVAERFDHLLVDEYQDTNAIQEGGEIVQLSRPLRAGPHRRRRRRAVDLFLPCRDGAQHLGFSGAPSIRRRAVVTLDRSYRSTGPILAAANAVIALAAERYARRTSGATARPGAPPSLVTVAGGCRPGAIRGDPCARQSRGGRSAQIPELCCFAPPTTAPRSNWSSRGATFPSSSSAASSFSTPGTWKDALALLRFAENPRDRIAGFRVAQLLPGVGPKIAETIVDAAAADDGFAGAVDSRAAGARADGARDICRPGCAASRPAPRPGRASLPDAVAWLSPLIETRYDDAYMRIGDLEGAGADRRLFRHARAFS